MFVLSPDVFHFTVPYTIPKSSKIENFQNPSTQLIFRKWHGLYYLKRELLIKNGGKITLKSARNLDFRDFHFTDPYNSPSRLTTARQ